MKLQLTYEPYTLHFKFDAGTSRGVMRERKVWFLRLFDTENPDVVGVGEVAPLAGLSLDALPDAEMEQVLQNITQSPLPQRGDLTAFFEIIEKQIESPSGLGAFPSIRFGLETAIFDFQNGGKGHIFDKDFFEGKRRLTTNGLIWMGTPDFMQSQIEEKLAQGFQCLKLKIGALDFEQEIAILKNIRKQYTAQDITLRVDANGAFSPTDALEKLKRLSELDIHSIEQPIKAGQIDEMARLCELSPLPIALDEELIPTEKTLIFGNKNLLKTIKPQYIILKPSFLGGAEVCKEWIACAEELEIGWWMTSALESNIGLNAICQFTSSVLNIFDFGKQNPDFPQGLGTGSLYHNNTPSRLTMEGQKIFLK
jgi:o-succinylbenzoate synthase